MEIGQTLNDINQLTTAIENNLIQLGLNYIDKHKLNIMSIYQKNKIKFDLCMKLRDNMLYKIGCINFHLKLLFQLYDRISNQFKQHLFNEKKRINLIIYSGKQQLFLFDDIIFHLISLFDYLGNLIGFIYYGEQRIRIKWKGIVGWCINLASEKSKTGKILINNSKVCPLILKYQKSLVFRLEEYRASLFHYGKDSTISQSTINIMSPQKSKFSIKVPKDLQKSIKELAVQSEEKELTLSDAAIWLVKQSFMTANEILGVLVGELKNASQNLSKPR